MAQSGVLACGGCLNLRGDVLRELTHIDLFSGIGGFALAARWAGIKTVQFVEIDPFCRRVLQKNFPEVPIHDDIKTFTNAKCSRFNGQTIPIQSRESQQEGSLPTGCNQRPFLLTGGFPCQPFSCAGKRRGKEDDRYLWEEMLRVIKEFQPTWIIGENVNGIRSMEFKDGISELEGDSPFQEDGNGDYTNVLDGICDSLEAIGYEVQPLIIPACAVNAPHRRDRVWIVANSTATGTGEQTRTVGDEGRQTHENWGEGIRQGHGQTCTSGVTSADCHAPDTGDQGLQGGKETGNLGINGEESRNELVGGFITTQWEQDWYSVALRTCVRGVDARLPRGIHRTDRLKSLGNSVVPQIPYLIMKAILETYHD